MNRPPEDKPAPATPDAFSPTPALPGGATPRPARLTRRILLAAMGLLILLAAWLAAGPWLAIRGIERAIAQRDTAALERHVDFPRLRSNLKAQIDDRIVRATGGTFGAVALALSGHATTMAVESMATPMGIGALLQGHAVWQRATGDTRGDGLFAEAEPARPLEAASHRYESLSRFRTTVEHADGSRTVFLLERQGLRWRLVDIRLSEDLSTYLR